MDQAVAFARARAQLHDMVAAEGEWEWEARDPNGKLLWRDGYHNLVVDEGLNQMLGVFLDRSTSPAWTNPANWYVGIQVETSSPAYAASDTLATNPGWNEVTAYTNSPDVRPTFVDGGVSSKSLNNSANKATFSIDADSTNIDGGFLASDNTVGGTSGILYSVGAFSGGRKTLGNGDTLEAQGTFSLAAS